ncbi:MAG: excinuclease ABC subunit UvrC [Armatimonadetes bacterium]|nr:excinuclease ABC subunit UvrC [Armatimonadota bacterium]
MKLPDLVVDKLKLVPTNPGCYIYRNEKGEVLYVGKALNLRNRVRSYFQESARHGLRIARLVQKTRDIEWLVVDSEVEALVLECNLIKQHRPPFNVRLRDDKSYPYIVITKEKFPRVIFTRNPKQGAGKVFGPFTSAWSVRETLDILHKTFPLIPCGKSWSGRAEQKPCLYFHLGQCLAPCAGLSEPTEYQRTIERVEKFLSGRSDQLLEDLQKQMQDAAEELEFERAATIRDQIESIERIQERQKVLTSDGTDRDVIAVVRDDRGSAIQMLYVRGGKLIGQRQFILDGSAEAAPTEAVQEFVKQYYSESTEIPREILLPVEIEERNIVQTWLRGRRGSAVSIDVPQGGEKLKLMDMAATNAEQALSNFRAEMEKKEAWADEAMSQLAEALNLPAPPNRIEGYDISNIQGTAPVGSMVVVENGEAAKSEYRRFKIRYHPEDPNDFAMMHEVITRRLRNYLDKDEKFSKLPDLIMIDGGKGQLSAALQARDELGLTIPMVGLAKRHELLYIPIEGSVALPEKPEQSTNYQFQRVIRHYEYTDVELPLMSPGLLLLRKLRDEAHRFALTFHRKLRDKRMTGSVIEEIPGVGPRRRRLLLRTFGSVDGIRRASVEELAAVPTMTKRLAEVIYDFLREE